MTATEPVLVVRDLHVQVRSARKMTPIVRGVSLELYPGEILGVVGESGSGKTMTAMSLVGLLPESVAVTGGQVLFKGEDLMTVSPARLRQIRGHHISVVFQDPMKALNPLHRVGRQIAEPLWLHQLAGTAQGLSRAQEMLGHVGVPASAERVRNYPHEFSGGMRQRVLIAMALMCRPEIVIADEPTTGLDVTIQVQILDLLRRMNREFGLAVMLISHDLALVASVCQRIQVMYAGRIVESGPTEAVLSRPKHPYTRALVRAVPSVDIQPGEPLEALPGTPPDLSQLPPGCSLYPRCPFRLDRCVREEPTLETIVPGHRAACWVTQAGEELGDAH